MKHIIWDFNGTLLADAQLSVDADNDVFDALGLPRITLETYRKHMTMPVRDFYAALGIDLSVYPYETISRLWLERFNAGAVAAGLVPGALEAVRRFERLAITQSVLSASYEPSLRAQCDALGLTPHMREIEGLTNEKAEKKTDIGLRQMERLALAPQETVLVGDMEADAELARALGVSCVLVSWGHNDLERLVNTGCPVVHTFDELATVVESMP
ncbi:MAG: HAD family hydrolase [Clostridia bacterium]|nr:HAD family hydrolase [Clostridia bacterium]